MALRENEPFVVTHQVKSEEDLDAVIDAPSGDAISYTLLAYGLDLTGRIERFRDISNVTLDRMRAYYTQENVQEYAQKESNAYAEFSRSRELVTKVGYSFLV